MLNKSPLRTSVVFLSLLVGCGHASPRPGGEHRSIATLAREEYFAPDEVEAKQQQMGMLDKPAPPLALHGWHDGRAIGAEDRRGKIVLIDFWATWCRPCIAQIPHTNAIAAKYGGRGVVVFGACSPFGAQRMEQVVAEHGIQYPTGKLSDSEMKAWGIAFWPTFAIVDRAGKLRAIGLRPDYVEPALDALLAEQPGVEKR